MVLELKITQFYLQFHYLLEGLAIERNEISI